jgi:hypothetical protein
LQDSLPVTVSQWTVSPPLPIGLTFNPLNGVISGRPSAPFEPTPFLVSAHTNYGVHQAYVTIGVVAPPPPPPPPPPAKASKSDSSSSSSASATASSSSGKVGGREPCSEADFKSALEQIENVASTQDNAVMHFECAKIHRCCRPPANNVSIDDIVFLVMASSVNRGRTDGILKSWGKDVPQENLWLFSDQADDSLRMVTLPEIQGRADRDGAQHRTPRGTVCFALSSSAPPLQLFLFRPSPSLFQVPSIYGIRKRIGVIVRNGFSLSMTTCG